MSIKERQRLEEGAPTTWIVVFRMKEKSRSTWEKGLIKLTRKTDECNIPHFELVLERLYAAWKLEILDCLRLHQISEFEED